MTRPHGQAKKNAALSTSGIRSSDAFDGQSLIGLVQRSAFARSCFSVKGEENSLYNNLIFNARPHGQAVKTPPSHGGIRSSILLGGAKQKRIDFSILFLFCILL